MVALLGPSGCGKTTCLRMIAGLIRPTSGDVFVNDKQMTGVPVHRRNVGMLFQNYALFPHLTVEENIAFGLEMRGISKADAASKVGDALNLVQLPASASAIRRQLSGGQQQRVALAACPGDRAGDAACSTSRSGRSTRGFARACRSSCAPSAPARPDHRHGDPRPGRGPDDGRQDRGHARRQARAGRLGDGNLPASDLEIRCAVHRRIEICSRPIEQRNGSGGSFVSHPN